jgi:hypothetical protein
MKCRDTTEEECAARYRYGSADWERLMRPNLTVEEIEELRNIPQLLRPRGPTLAEYDRYYTVASRS